MQKVSIPDFVSTKVQSQLIDLLEGCYCTTGSQPDATISI